MLITKTIITIFFIVVFTKVLAQPAITSFYPLNGLAGTTVVITGTNFSSTIANNFVRFGHARAVVTAASPTSLTVKVPRGATLLPISVMVNGLIAYSLKPFNISSGCNAPLAFSSFDSSKSFSAGSGDWMISAGDLDGDGKTDIVYGNYQVGQNMSIHRNTSTPGNISLEPKVDYAVGVNPDDQVICDFDGDFKPDIIVATVGNATYDLAIFRNTSVTGNIGFAPRMDMNTGVVADKLTTADIDNDGKTDLIISFSQTNMLGILKNISTTGNIAFAPIVEFPVFVRAGFVSAGDVDGDGKVDVVVSNFFNPTLSVLRNTTSGGVISFAAAINIPLNGNTVHGNAIADLNLDGKPDIVAVYVNSTFITYLTNTSTPGNISFQAPVDLSIAPSESYNIAIDDFDGDQKPDLAFSSSYGLAVMKNTSTGGIVSFAPLQKYPVDLPPYTLLVADMDNDGKPDVIAGMGAGGTGPIGAPTISILRNRVCEDAFACQGGNFTIASNIIGSAYQWQLDTGSGFTSIPGSNSNQLQLANITLASLNNKYRCIVDGLETSIFILKFGNTWLGTVSTAWEDPANWSCGTVPDIDTDVFIPSGTVQLNLSTSVNSLVVDPGATLTVGAGVNLTVVH